MKSAILFLTAALAAPVASLAANPPAKKPIAPQNDLGMVIRGDQEAPLVLYIVPWQESRVTALPEAPLVPLLPRVLDHDRSLIDDPAQRSLDPTRAKNK